MSFGKNLVKYRKQRGLTQEELVKLCGVGISQIRRYEADKSTPSLNAIIKIVKVIGISIDEMVFDKKSDIAESKIVDRELLEQFEMISNLEDDDEKNAVKKILEGVIVKNQVERLMKPKMAKSWSQRFKEITDRLAEGVQDHSPDEIDDVIDEAVATVREKRYAHS